MTSSPTTPRTLAIIALILLAACDDTDRARWNNQEADRVECAAKGGVQSSGTCFKVDSIIPMTGPRVNPSTYKP